MVPPNLKGFDILGPIVATHPFTVVFPATQVKFQAQSIGMLYVWNAFQGAYPMPLAHGPSIVTKPGQVLEMWINVWMLFGQVRLTLYSWISKSDMLDDYRPYVMDDSGNNYKISLCGPIPPKIIPLATLVEDLEPDKDYIKLTTESI